MKIKLVHTSVTVSDMARAIKFYEEALQMSVLSTKELPHLTIVLMKDNTDSGFEFEMLCPKAGAEIPTEKSTHFAFTVEDFDELHRIHKEMGCIQRELPTGVVYFITDPDGNQIEIMKA